MTAPIYVTNVAHSPMPRGRLLGRWHWEIRDGGPEGKLLASGTAWFKRRAIADREKARARCKRRYAHVRPKRPITEEQHEANLALVNRLVPFVAAGWRKADDITLLHEAERLEAEPTSPITKTLRLIVEAERAERAARAGAVSAQ